MPANIHPRARTLLVPALAAAFIGQAGAETIQFKPVDPAVVEQRFNQVVKKNSERADALRKLFVQAGCAGDKLTDQAIKGSDLSNIVCTLAGSGNGVVVVGAHYDKSRGGEGAVDNWSGAALLPSLYESLAGTPRNATFVFVGFADQDRAGSGAASYVKASGGKLSNVRAMVNLSCLGLSPTKVALDHSNKELVNALARIAASMKLPVSGMDLGGSMETGAIAFQKKKVPVVDLHSITQQTASLPGSDNDSRSAVNMDEYKTTYRLVSAYLAYLDLVLAKPAPAASASQ